MSKARVIAAQLTLDGGQTPAGDVKEKVAAILAAHPEARDDYKALMFWYWYECDGLRELLGDLPALREAFRTWFLGVATSPKTLQNRAMEVQNETPALEAAPRVEAWRRQQARAGVVR